MTLTRYQEILNETREEVDGNLLEAVTLLLVELRLLRDQIGDGVGTYETRSD